MNYFELFGIQAQFDINLSSLSETYKSLQKTVHPDRFAHSSGQEKRVAVQRSAQINDGYQILKNPIKRSEHLLIIRGTELPNEQASFSDPQFLMAQMELREMLDDVKHASDKDAAFFEATECLDQQYQQLLVDLHKQLAENTIDANTHAAQTTRKLKFYQKLHDELDRLEEQLFD